MRTTMGIAAIGLALTGCSPGPDNGAAPASEANAAADTTPEGPSLAARLFGGGKPIRLDQQKLLENGAVVTLTAFQAKQDEAVLGIRIVNGADRDIMLDWSDHKTYLVAGGQKFFLSPPLENADLKVVKGSKMEGELVFLGSVPKGAAVTLVVNDGMNDSQYNNTPGFSLPLQATEAAWSDDGSKKKLSSLTFAGDLARTQLRAAAGGGSNLRSEGVGASTLTQVQQLQSRLGATETDRGTVVSLPGDVTFDFDKATIRADARPTLDTLAELIKAQNPPSVAVEGHSDSKGADAYNQTLSEARATAVRDYLISVRTVDGTKLVVKGFGELKPVAPNQSADGRDDEAGRARNRRVEVILAKPPS